jgi:hypothetical protein
MDGCFSNETIVQASAGKLSAAYGIDAAAGFRYCPTRGALRRARPVLPSKPYWTLDERLGEKEGGGSSETTG